jgi:aminoglycoside N3'-acetyltransferase
MPTVLRVGGFQFSFFAGDHEPAHVHVRNSDGIAVIAIATAETTRQDGNMREMDVRRAEAMVAEHRDVLQAAWDEFASKRGKQWP